MAPSPRGQGGDLVAVGRGRRLVSNAMEVLDDQRRGHVREAAMRIVQIVPGSGETFYCQNCLRDTALIKQLSAQGHEVLMVPMYLPMPDETVATSNSPVFYGAIRIYLRQKLRAFRRTPRFLDRLLDSRPLLALAAKMSGSTRARGLEQMTLSMLRGEQGRQASELEEMIQWLVENANPDIIHLSNALLSGLAPRLREAFKVPVVCSLQDEHQWVDAMAEPYVDQVWDLIAANGRSIDTFVAVSDYYAALMAGRMKIAEEKIQVVPIGIDTEGYQQAAIDLSPPVIGYLSRMAESLGLGMLIEAFILLRQDRPIRDLKLKVMGGRTGTDTAFLDTVRRRLKKLDLLSEVEFVEGFSRAERINFLGSVDVLSVPVFGGEAFGTYLLEAMASGVPVVQPREGAFPELVEATGGGIIYQPNDSKSLAEALRTLLSDPGQARKLGRQGREVVNRRFTIAKMAENTLKVYERCLDLSPPGTMEDG